MRVLLAPDRFAGTLSATEAGEAMRTGWLAGAAHDEVDVLPLSDGGEGLLDVLTAALGGELLALTVRDPLGTPVPAAVLVVDEAPGRPRTAWVETAQALGPHLVGAGHRRPDLLSSAGVGDLLAAAVDTGARRVVVGVGASAVHDAGAGLLAALGAGRPERLGRGGLALGDVTADDLGGLDDAVRRLAGTELVLATAADLPLLGLQGTSATEAEERGATPAQAQELERAFGHLADLVRRARPARTDLLTGAALRPEKAPGAGAGGGVGWALHVLGARYADGAALVADELGLPARVAAADLVVTGEGSFGWRSLRGRVVSHVAQAALAAGVPSIVLAGQVSVGRREAMAAGLSGTYAVAERPRDLAATLADPARSLTVRAARVAGTWSPGS
ncbi:glycerate kinase family protein [Lapillicoccus jejuensis]|uniref:Glycerate kinase n=1 Tax=Lapillicoccus jejuensis TaxID=402171 RepID=A0A542E5S0_9MICO|nr:glycerate kinase [Lapillicoccus jejuensis]TQJ10667.1 glycerate kinase [Lapillicoccus jejuensis]